MLLIGVKASNGWLSSRWNLTYRVAWEQLLKACAFASDYYEQFEVLVDDQVVPVESKKEYLDLEEAERLSFRGVSTIVGVPIMITFYNQLSEVDVAVAMVTDEFEEADYETFNKALGQYLDSIELVMYR